MDEDFIVIDEDLYDEFSKLVGDFANEQNLDLKTLYALLTGVTNDIAEQLGPEKGEEVH